MFVAGLAQQDAAAEHGREEDAHLAERAVGAQVEAGGDEQRGQPDAADHHEPQPDAAVHRSRPFRCARRFTLRTVSSKQQGCQRGTDSQLGQSDIGSLEHGEQHGEGHAEDRQDEGLTHRIAGRDGGCRRDGHQK